MNILIINAGSSSIKYEWFDLAQGQILCNGLLERIGQSGSRLSHAFLQNGRMETRESAERVADHQNGMQLIQSLMKQTVNAEAVRRLHAIGHRVVHGGTSFQQPVRIDDDVMRALRELVPLAPLHNPANIEGIDACRRLFPDLPQVAVFDTAFHQDMPEHAYLYALPQALNTKFHIRRYGFHGTSHAFVCKRAAEFLNKPIAQTRFISLHLGNGASAAAIKGGRSIDTSMGMTPLEGLMMGSRCGDIDPGLTFYLHNTVGLSLRDIDKLYLSESGLKGIAGVNDMREILARAAEQDKDAVLALTMYCYRIKKYLGAYLAVLGPVDAVLFTGGVGENAAAVRAQSLANLQHLGFALDHAKNERAMTDPVTNIAAVDSRSAILVIHTDEEWEIAEQTAQLLQTQ